MSSLVSTKAFVDVVSRGIGESASPSGRCFDQFAVKILAGAPTYCVVRDSILRGAIERRSPEHREQSLLHGL